MFKKFIEINSSWLIALTLSVGIVYCCVRNSRVFVPITLFAFIVVVVKALFISCEEENEKKRLLELEKRYRYYVELVNIQVQETLKQFRDTFEIDTSSKYLISFDDYRKWICRKRVTVGKPNSFIIASCLMYALVDQPIITAKETTKEIEIINIEIAMNCAFKIIAEPTTYYEDNLILVEEKHSKVSIIVPEGLNKNSNLYQEIISAIYRDGLKHKKTSIMQFANLLHLIYLNCC